MWDERPLLVMRRAWIRICLASSLLRIIHPSGRFTNFGRILDVYLRRETAGLGGPTVVDKPQHVSRSLLPGGFVRFVNLLYTQRLCTNVGDEWGLRPLVMLIDANQVLVQPLARTRAGVHNLDVPTGLEFDAPQFPPTPLCLGSIGVLD